MSQSESSLQSLLGCFFKHSEESFRFLELKHDFRVLNGLAQYQNNYKIIRPWKYADANSFMNGESTALIRYEKDEIALEVCYTKPRLSIEGYVYFGPIHRFEFSEILTAAKKNDPEIQGDIGLGQEDLIISTLQNMAKALRKYKRFFIKRQDKLVDRAHVIRSKRLEHSVRQHFKTLMDANSEKAARAYAYKDFEKVVQLLQPYEPYLSNGDMKKLTLARKSIQHDMGD